MKIALIGCGGFARVHADAIRKVPGPRTEIVAVSRDKDHALKQSPLIGADAAIAPYDAAFDDPTIDAVCILTPHDTHIPLAVRALESGEHVYLEKPAARTVAEAEPLARAMQRHPDRVLMVGENFHYVDAVGHGAEIVKAGRIGRLQMIQMHHAHFVQNDGWRAQREPMGGGALIDGGIHLVHGLRRLVGEVRTVCAAEPKTKTSSIEGEAALQMLFTFDSGATGIATYSWDFHANPTAPTYLLLGTKGSLKVYLDRAESELFTKVGNEPEALSTIPADGAVDSMTRALGAFLDAIRTGRSPEMTLAEGLRDVAVVEAAYRSIASDRVENVPPLPEWCAF